MKLNRRRYINDAGVQIRYALLFVLISLISNVIAVTVFNSMALKRLDALMWSTHIGVSSTDEVIRPVFIFVNAVNFIVVALMLVLTGFLMMKKTSGPLIRMTRDIRKISDGDLTFQIALRQKDDFKDVADELNRMTDSLREYFTELKNRYEGIAGPMRMLGKEAGAKVDSASACDSVIRDIEVLESELKKLHP
ncbi:MAG: methyl-accepting chemotaxis protein [Nitrospirota bacterium]